MGNCNHDSTTKTVNAGISRTVCNACGHVQLEFAKATFAADEVQPVAAASA